jgi:hypothetical protein
MNKELWPFLLAFILLTGCNKTTTSSPIPTPPVVIQPALAWTEYDAAYTSNSGTFYYYSYHVKDTLYYSEGKNYRWITLIYNASDTFFRAHGQLDSLTGQNKGCVALISNMDPSQQGLYNYYIGSYYKFSLFNDTAVGNVQFMVPTDGFPSVDSIPVGVAFLNFTGGLNSFYTGMAISETKITPEMDFVRLGDSTSYANNLIPAKGSIDSVEVHLLIRRFSDNGIHPNLKITRTMDGHFILKFYYHDGSFLNIINGEFKNLFFQKSSM